MMKTNFRQLTGTLAIAAGLAVSGAAAPVFQDQAPDYSKNKTYR
jgi:hypothetical protein